jgi:hypothetical protein
MKLMEFLDETRRYLDAGEAIKDAAIITAAEAVFTIKRLEGPIDFARRARDVSTRLVGDATRGEPPGTLDTLLGIGEMILGSDSDDNSDGDGGDDDQKTRDEEEA